MPKRFSISSLSAEQLNEFHQRLYRSNFSNYEGHAAWLETKGVQASKSTAHRYGQEYEAKIRSEQQGQNMTPESIEVRLRCLEAAVAFKQAQTPADVLKQADEFLKWVYTL